MCTVTAALIFLYAPRYNVTVTHTPSLSTIDFGVWKLSLYGLPWEVWLCVYEGSVSKAEQNLEQRAQLFGQISSLVFPHNMHSAFFTNVESMVASVRI